MKQIIFVLLAVVLLISGGCEDSNRKLQPPPPTIALGMKLKIHVPKGKTAKLSTMMRGNNRKTAKIGSVLFHEYCDSMMVSNKDTVLKGGSGDNGTDYEISHYFYNDTACYASGTKSTKNLRADATNIDDSDQAKAIVTYDTGYGDQIQVTIEMANMTVLIFPNK